MAANMFVKISDIPGDATEKGKVDHTGWIVIKSLSWSVERAVDMTDLGTTQRGHANSNFQKVSVTSELGLASSRLMLSVANGTVRPEILIDQCRAGSDVKTGLEPYLLWKLYDSMVCKYEVTASEDGPPEETWEIAYRSLDVEYKGTDPKTNALVSKGTFDWNLETGKSK